MRSYFNPRAPYGARLSRCMVLEKIYLDFNPRAPYGARLIARKLTPKNYTFQSTRPIRGATSCMDASLYHSSVFQSTRPIRGATRLIMYYNHSCVISIHAPHTGRDSVRSESCHPHRHFNPRAPYGARLYSRRRSITIDRFQSTRPIRGATAKMHNLCSAFLQ